MAITVTKAVWKHSRAKGNRLLVLLALADFTAEEKVQRGYPALAFPSQTTLAQMCRCERSTVQLALEALQKTGEIRDTGERHWGRYRGTVEWEVLPDIDFLADLDLTEYQATDIRSGNPGRLPDDDDLTDSPEAPDRFSDDLTDSPEAPDRQVGHKPVVEPVVNPVARSGSAASPADAAALRNSSDEEVIFDPERLALYALLDDDGLTPWDDERRSALQRLAELDGEEITMDMWARRLPELVGAV